MKIISIKQAYILTVCVSVLLSVATMTEAQSFAQEPLAGYRNLYEVGASMPSASVSGTAALANDASGGIMPLAGRGGFIPNPPDVDDTEGGDNQRAPNGYPLGDALLPLLACAFCFALLRFRQRRQKHNQKV